MFRYAAPQHLVDMSSNVMSAVLRKLPTILAGTGIVQNADYDKGKMA